MDKRSKTNRTVKRNYGKDYKKHLEARGAQLLFLNTDNLSCPTIWDVVKQAKKLSGKYKTVEFEFNGIRVQVNKDTDEKMIARDYIYGSRRNWTHIGPVCNKYDTRTEKAYQKVLDKMWER